MRSGVYLTDSSWINRLPHFDGEIAVDGKWLDIAELDFGKVRRHRPLAVLKPANSDDVATAINFCRSEKIPLAARGHAHSAGGQMMVRGGLVIDMKSMDKICEITNDFVIVEGGIAWSEVLYAAIDRGLTPPVVTDWLSVSVGGTVSMGGFGFMSFHRGTQMDHLLELEVVTGTGEKILCSPTENKEIFDLVRGTHGQFALITKAKIPLEPAPDSVRMVQAAYGSVDDLLSDINRLSKEHKVDLIHGFAAEKTPESVMTRMNSTDKMNLGRDVVESALENLDGNWVYNLEISDLQGVNLKGPRADLSKLKHLPGCIDIWEISWKEFCFRLPPLIIEEELQGAAPHPELTVFIPFSEGGVELMKSEFKRLHPIDDIGGGPVLFFPLNSRLITAPYLKLPLNEHSFFFGLLRRATPPTSERINQQISDNESIYKRVLNSGGVRYLPDTLPENKEFWSQHFDNLWPILQSYKSRFDPDGIFLGSFGEFIQNNSD